MSAERFMNAISDKYLENIATVFKKLYRDDSLTDVTLYTKEGSIKAHKLVLSSISPYFYKFFQETKQEHPYIWIYGVSLRCLKHLIELIYHGTSNIADDDKDIVFQLAVEFGIVEQLIDSGSQQNSIDNVRNIDTRFKGQKRVAVDFQDFDDNAHNSTRGVEKSESSSVQVSIKEEGGSSPETSVSGASFSAVNNVVPKLNAWARKQRKFTCHLCPSSFKRASHLSRHQLVHTGERPYGCDQCDKAFSRHDKLKHHIRKAHSPHLDTEILVDNYDPLETNSSLCLSDISCRTPATDAPEWVTPPVLSPQELGLKRLSEAPPLCKIANINSVNDEVAPAPAKKGRGRPRKYTPIDSKSITVKRGRGRPRIYPINAPQVGNYDITNLPYGDLDMLTNSFESNGDANSAIDIPELLEPLVEIQTEQQATKTEIDQMDDKTDYVGRIGQCTVTLENGVPEAPVKEGEKKDAGTQQFSSDLDQVVKIGECTISVTN